MGEFVSSLDAHALKRSVGRVTSGSASSEPLRVLIIDGDLTARKRAVSVIEEEIDLAVVGEGSSGFDAVVLVDRLRPDVVLVDMQLPGMTASEVAATITEAWPTIAVVGLGWLDDVSDPQEIIRSGAVSTMDKTEVHKLPDEIRRSAELVRGTHSEGT